MAGVICSQRMMIFLKVSQFFTCCTDIRRSLEDLKFLNLSHLGVVEGQDLLFMGAITVRIQIGQFDGSVNLTL